ncbi:NADH-quinone oxidoreductase subunit L [Methylacidimicrobium cyclopophantes]|uniref:NADH-quinone oxidoreductase subunit L n=1 Tax=Methylacidimicrobium cyclopophantes TaxID=1041766 RepID=A0A5E6MI60_9BACT|nr:NADH-quinone oxidoreductase subunit L [Methylacidimicrobium cyclopophantes]VVM05176.1 NADH-quinone oxidoreductase subunit L [Methylacidimicrobium cyclopophantes]
MAWLLLLAPLVSAFLVWVAFRRHPRASQAVSITASLITFLTAIGIALGKIEAPASLAWIDLPGLRVEIGMTLDSLARLMLLMVTGVAFLIHVYSLGYMAEDPGRGRFFGELSLFLASMIGIIVSTNFIMMYIFWELVGVSSYLLIGFWFEKNSAADAARKAFLANRVGDFGFLLGILTFWATCGTVAFDPAAARGLAGNSLAPIAALLLFCGCIGKSAQIPLHVWLPDAMEGPTPVSALIHAATMVAAGVYMLCRIFFVLELSPEALSVIAWTGGITALVAALIATQQNDIKRVLAYSTMSQLGYMVLAVGCAGTTAAMFHLTTHGFFKALLFMGAGSVLHALHHEQDIWRMGGVGRKMPLTFATFGIGAAALAGIPGLSGFFSKEDILQTAAQSKPALFWIAALTAALTAFYMTRITLVAFLGKPRTEVATHAKESPLVMGIPLIILAGLAIVAGYPFFGILHYLGAQESAEKSLLVPAASLTAVILGLTAGAVGYGRATRERIVIPLLERKFYFDEIYDWTILKLQEEAARLLAWIDQWIIGFFLVRGGAFLVSLGGEMLRLLQAGNLREYAFFFALGAGGILLLLFGH